MSPPVVRTPGLVGRSPEDLHPRSKGPAGHFVFCPQTLRLNRGPTVVLISQGHLQMAGGRVVLHPTLPVCVGRGGTGELVSLALQQPGTLES